MRLLRWMELALALSMVGLLLIAGPLRPGLPNPPAPGPAAPERAASAEPAAEPGARTLLEAAAARHALAPHLVAALAYWESGWDQTRVSKTGAVGLMQVQPEVAADLGPRLLGRRVNLADATDNAEIGTAILRAYIDDHGGSVEAGLAAYYQGPASLAEEGMQPDTQGYVAGILALSALLDAGRPLPANH